MIQAWGGGFWKLLDFTLQMALVIITGYVVATARPVYRVIAALAGLPRTPRGAVALVAFFAMTSSWLNWGFSLIFSAMLAKEVARRVCTLFPFDRTEVSESDRVRTVAKAFIG